MADGTNRRGFASMDPDEQHEIAQKGGQSSPGKFGSPQGANPHEAGREGARRQPREAKVAGGRNSHRGEQAA
ncbi:MAG TPA: KGG domain-containing protein [Candidatus Saccharimonadales bacterium]|nr:KGG domain-containing protein [Candidatus Saccharimonadales bacterium]